MKKLTIIALALALGFGLSGGAFAANMSKADYKAAQKRIDAEEKADKATCKSMSGNAKDICMKEANGKENVAKAELDAQYKPNSKSDYKVRKAKADAAYAVAKEKCDDMKGNEKQVCVKEAKAARTAARGDAKADKKTVAARKDAKEDKRDADYAVAKEKCDTMSGAAKDKCVADAKARYSK